MAAPMRDPPLEGGHRAKPADRAAPRTDHANFEYDDNEWDIGIGDLIIDLDADIEKSREGTAAAAMASAPQPGKAANKMGADHSATLDKGLKMKIKRTKPGGKASEAKHEIVKPGEVNGGAEEPSAAATPPAAPPVGTAPVAVTAATVAAASTPGANAPARRASGAHRRDKTREKHPEVNGVATTPPAPTPAAPPAPPSTQDATPATPEPRPRPPQANSPPAKKTKTEPKESADVCVGTSVGTITEPDCLGPCEPGTSVTLEGIVWHETEGGVLVVNVTWRGKTYVGTLLDCTRHDWAPPRFCDSPTEELDARTPKGRGKRGRAAAPGGDLSNFTETRSSVHSKLRNGGAKGRRGGGSGTPTGNVGAGREVPSPPPATRSEPVSSPVNNSTNKRKSRASEEDSPASKRRTPASPPASPALLECPEPNCSKKYKHINGLKYHQSHAHGTIDDDEVKDIASMSENDESNMEAPSPIGPIKSPEKLLEPGTPKKDERQDASTPAPGSRASSPPPPPATIPTPTVPAAPPVILPMVPPVIPTPAIDGKPPLVKPGVLRFGPQAEDFTGAGFINKTSAVPPGGQPPVSSAPPTVASVRPSEPTIPSVPVQINQSHSTISPAPLPLQHPAHSVHAQLPLTNHVQHSSQPNPQINSSLPQNLGTSNQQKGPPTSPQNSQFKVKPTAALMPVEDKKLQDSRILNKSQGAIKKNKSRKSPAGSPLPPEQITTFGIEQTGRDDVQSPAYSDISDDTAPVMESEVDKNKLLGEKKSDSVPHSMPGYGMYQFYPSQYLMPSVQSQSNPDQIKIKDDSNKTQDGKNLTDKDGKRDGHPDIPPQKIVPPHFYPYSYMPPGYPYNMDPGYGSVSMITEEKLKDQQERDRENSKDSSSPAEHSNGKTISNPSPLIVPGKPKASETLKDGKHQNENHQILKESIEMKSQMNPYYQRHQQQAHQQSQHQHQDDMRRYYVSFDHRREKNNSVTVDSGKSPVVQSSSISGKSQSSQPPSQKPSKDIKVEEGTKLNVKDEPKSIKQEGQKPTMETTGPPPPPTSQYFLHPSYMPPSHYGGLPFDPIYRNLNPMIVPSYAPGPYLHPGPIPRYHAPEDLSRPPPPKTLELLHHHPSQYYSTHKIHELQERALKSPTPKAPGPGGSPGGGNISTNNTAPGPLATPPAKSGTSATTPNTEATPNKDSRSPPPQRHVHTHHHTHVGLGYPIYPAPYGAAVLASQQAAAVTVVNSFPPK